MGAGQGRAGRDGAGGWLFEPTFNRAIKLRQADPRITSDAGALLLREVDHRLGLTADLAAQLRDDRDPQRIRYEQVELLRQHVYARARGYARQGGQGSWAHDAALKLAVGDRSGKRVRPERPASQPAYRRGRGDLASQSNRQGSRTAAAEGVRLPQRYAGDGRKVTHGTLDSYPVPCEGPVRQ